MKKPTDLPFDWQLGFTPAGDTTPHKALIERIRDLADHSRIERDTI